MYKYIQAQANIRNMNDLNNQVFEHVEKNPDAVVKQFRAYLESQKDKEKEPQYDYQEFQNYDMQGGDDEDEDEDDRGNKFSNNNMGRLNKYAMS
mmetsp:Transcript_41552/g.47939  ORF Transcript_41552/g.47939 Transcript_41552/m.47939 type:complete len:94 (+) Transcript_41552:1938-2219(+)